MRFSLTVSSRPIVWGKEPGTFNLRHYTAIIKITAVKRRFALRTGL